ncbi:MAG: dihydroorotase [Chthoniobacterales bacterium]|nr:dihydroorotase [Chthoniobacterales bacterium]
MSQIHSNSSPFSPLQVLPLAVSSKPAPPLLIRNGRIIDPANQRDEIADLFIQSGVIIGDPPAKLPTETQTLDASGLIVAPGLIDIHVHLREPGAPHKETIESGTFAAAAGGFTSVLAMPNTSPPCDSPAAVMWLLQRILQKSSVRVFIAGAITKSLAGEELAPIGSMLKAGIVAITDDGHCVQNHEVMRRALEYASMFQLPVLDHCQDYNLSADGVMHEGQWSLRLGLQGWPRIAEEVIVARNILLAELCSTPIHIQHVSSAGSVRLLREASARKLKITAEVCPHHLWFTDEKLQNFDSTFKVNPPLRERHDIEALLEAIVEGTITIFASDHAPHANYEKEVEIDHAPFGMTGLETELAAFATLLIHRERAIDWPRLIACYTVNPARLLKLNLGTLTAGAPADLTLISPNLRWTFDRNQSFSLSKNTPFHGCEFVGRAVQTIVAGRTIWKLL